MARRLGSVGLLCAVAVMAAECRCTAAPAEHIVRWDWYFRESLGAIRDWEDTLGRLDKEDARFQAAPVFPVLANGEAVRWPNPIPQTLVPPEDRSRRLFLRMRDRQVQIERVGPRGAMERENAAPGATLLGYKHPGGGGKDQWYHHYHRRFDKLTTLAAKPAPFAVGLDDSLDLRLGRNVLAVKIRNVSQDPVEAAITVDFHRPDASRRCLEKTVRLGAGERVELSVPVELDRPGGGLVVISVAAGGESFWIPLLTHVEDLPAVFTSIEQILADWPDDQGAQTLARLQAAADTQDQSRDPWRRLFEDASRLRDELLLKRIPLDAILFVKRKPYFSEQPFMDAHHLFNRPGGGIYRLSPVRPDGNVTPVIDSLGEGVYRDVVLHWDADRFLFAFGNGSDKWDGGQSYHIYEANAEGSGVRQITAGPKNDCEPFYLPGGRIGFTSDRSEHIVMCGGDRHSPTLFACDADGSAVRQLSFNVFNDFNPTVLPDGRILYSRWEYNERSVTSLHNPFTMNPDGTMVSPYYGNATIRPNVVMFPRPVPGSQKVMALFTAHHGQTHGTIGLIDKRRGLDGAGPLEILTPGVPVTGENPGDSRGGWYSDPVPLAEDTYLCSFTPTVQPWLENSWGLYMGDRHGNLALVYRDPQISCAEPVPLACRAAPHAVASVLPGTEPLDAEDAEAVLALADVYVGLPGVRRGDAKYLRVLEDVPRKGVLYGGVILTSGTEIFTIKRVLGTVPIEADGSACFAVPANRNVYFEVLDHDQREIQRMRSVVCLKPGERRTCIGCHESRLTAPPNVDMGALRRAPSRPQPPPFGTQIVSFLRDVQPVLNDRCVACHTHDRQANGVILTDDLTDQFTVGYQELLPFLAVANANRWDFPEDVYARPPYTYGSKVSPLAELLAKGHHDVKLAEDERLRLINWIDANGVYYDRYEQVYGSKRNIFTGPVRAELEEVYGRRCASCHGGGDGRFATWWMSLNRRDVAMSRALTAPLAKSAGGWQRCDEPVFATTDDPDYQKLLAALTRLAGQLRDKPRADLLSIRGTPAEDQVVELPPPPPPRPPLEPQPDSSGWVYLSDLKWESARSGWTPNNDGLPRRDRDVQEKPLRLGTQRVRKGLGTHAPSEIVYRLEGKYDRFHARVCGAETGGTVAFQVFADDKLLFESGTMQGLRDSKTIDVDITGANRLRLVVTDGGDNYLHDMANWADARVQ